jgi:hypothetical protein
MKILFWLGVLLLPLCGTAQMHTNSNAWSYVTSTVTSALEFSATTVAGTGGTATHTMAAVVVYVQSPVGRTAGASNYSGGTTGQATVYLSLCGGGICEDGLFQASTVGTTEWLFRHLSGRVSGGFAPATPGFFAFLPIPSC